MIIIDAIRRHVRRRSGGFHPRRLPRRRRRRRDAESSTTATSFTGEEVLLGYGAERDLQICDRARRPHRRTSFMPFSLIVRRGEHDRVRDRRSGIFDSERYFTGGNVKLTITGLTLTAAPTGPTDAGELAASGPVRDSAAAYMAGSSGKQRRRRHLRRCARHRGAALQGLRARRRLYRHNVQRSHRRQRRQRPARGRQRQRRHRRRRRRGHGDLLGRAVRLHRGPIQHGAGHR